jgi:hypothetical protein
LSLATPAESRQVQETPEERRGASAAVFLAALALLSASGAVSPLVPAPALALRAAWMWALRGAGMSVLRAARAWVLARPWVWVAE